MKNDTAKSQIIGYLQAPFLEIRSTKNSDRCYETHAHPTLSIGFMQDSSTCFTTPKGSFILQAGALAVIEPYIQHSCNPINHTQRSYVMVYLDAHYCMKFQARHFKVSSSSTLLPLHSSLVFHEALFERFKTIILGLIQGYDPLLIENLESWLEDFFWLYTNSSQTQMDNSTMQDIAFYLCNRLDEPLNLKMLSHRFMMNSFVLVRQFKKIFGCTPTHYWHDARIHHAKKLLQYNTPLALCAQYCGFVDQSHFHRFFKRKTAMTPKEYQVNFIQ